MTRPADIPAALSELCRRDFQVFVERVFATLDPAAELERAPYLEILSDYLARAERGEIRRLLITIPHLGCAPGMDAGAQSDAAHPDGQLRQRSHQGAFAQLPEGHQLGLVCAHLHRHRAQHRAQHHRRGTDAAEWLPPRCVLWRLADGVWRRHDHHRRPDEGSRCALARATRERASLLRQ